MLTTVLFTKWYKILSEIQRVWVCVCEREKESERESEWEKLKERENETLNDDLRMWHRRSNKQNKTEKTKQTINWKQKLRVNILWGDDIPQDQFPFKMLSKTSRKVTIKFTLKLSCYIPLKHFKHTFYVCSAF